MSQPATQQELLFAEARESDVTPPDVGTWKMLIVDDEKEVHDVTKLALDGFKFSGAPLQFMSAYSGEEAKRMIADNPDIAIILLDVVMESDHAGLDVVKYVRDELKNQTTRIVLRTGQPGQAPERSVIIEYDINDYKDKTELTAQKLFTLMYSSLRSYRDILALEANRKGLRQVIDASANIFELQSMNQFTQGVLEQLISLLNLRGDAMYCQAKGFAATRTEDALHVIAATGEFEDYIGRDAWTMLDDTTRAQLETALSEQKNIHSKDYYAAYFKSKSGAENVLFVGHKGPLAEVEKNLVEVFCRNVSIAFDNMYLKQDIEDTQRDIVYRLGEAVETRSKETGYHVKRIAEYSHLFAEVLGLSDDEAEIIRLASPLHDVGKVAIPDAILNKPGRLTREEWEIMKTHATVGYDMFKSSKREILRAGAVIAHQHHEKWNGSGYPNGVGGTDIHIYGRIVALADVFDALGSERCYKKAWELDRILELLRAERGMHFDPSLVDIFFANLPEFLAIRDRLVEPTAFEPT